MREARVGKLDTVYLKIEKTPPPTAASTGIARASFAMFFLLGEAEKKRAPASIHHGFGITSSIQHDTFFIRAA